MSKKVFVVTDSELGWDCVVGVFDADLFALEQLKRRFNGHGVVIDERTIETSLDDWEIDEE